MSARSSIAVAALVCLCSSTAAATRHNVPAAPVISKGDARGIAGQTLRYAVSKSLGRASAKRAIGNRRGLFNAVKNHGVRVRVFELSRGSYAFQAHATIKTRKGKARKDVEAPFIAGDVDATTGAVTAWTISTGQIVRGRKFSRQLLPDFRDYVTRGSIHID